VYEFDLIPDIYGLDWIGLSPENWPMPNSRYEAQSSCRDLEELDLN